MTYQIPPSLTRFGAEFERASRRELSRRSRRRTFRLAAASSAALAAIAAAVVLVVGATTGAAPAYALTQNSDGSITISLNNLTTGISQQRPAQADGDQLHRHPRHAELLDLDPRPSAGPGSLSETITIGTENMEPAGVDGYLAAEQLPNGSIALGIGGMKAPLPTCFSPSTMTVSPSSTPDSNSTAAKSLTTSTIRSLPPTTNK